ncbi:MAG: tetratricopeptide repeat protein [Anaerolineales bacterium]|jgi:predicted ATPase/DNA-binding CsgD family transcriptional regulator
MFIDEINTQVEPLTDRELQVLDLISRGLSNREIADELVVTPGTIKWYNKQIYRKLGVNSRTKAVVQANKHGLFDRSPEIRSTPQVAYIHNLPAPLTSFIGREPEIKAIKQLLFDNRLLTLTGPGGSGKTRLAQYVAGDLTEQFLDGVFIVDLATIRDSQLFLSTISSALEVHGVPGEPLIETLKHALYGKQVLLLLDNFEQIINAAPFVSELLSSSPELKVMVTSRERLSIYGEQVFTVPPLSVPRLDQKETTQRLLQYEAIQLFYQRARAINPVFKITDENISSVAEICARLDGLPLAIELAAARSNLYSPEMIRDRLDSRLAILTGGSRNLPDRLRTLRGTLDWSYELLDAEEQVLLVRLSVFNGGGTLESADAVCAHGLSIDIMDGLESLLNKNLLYQEIGKLGEPRFYMLETIHEYAREMLADSGEAKKLELLHCRYFASFALGAEQEMYGTKQGYWLKKMRVEYDNLRTAIERSFKNAEDLLGFQIIGALRYFWYSDGLIAEGFKWIEVAQESEQEIPIEIRAKVYLTAADLSYAQGDPKKVNQYSRSAYELAKKSRDRVTLAWALLSRSKTFSMPQEQDIPKCITLSKESLALFRKLNFLPGTTTALTVLGEISRITGDYQAAEDYYRESLKLSRQAGDKKRSAVNLANLASVVLHRGDYQQAEQFEREALEIDVELGIKHYVGLNLTCLAGILAKQGSSMKAAILLGASEKILQTMGVTAQPADQVDLDDYLAVIHEQLNEEQFEAALAEGRKMSYEQAVSYALDKQDS